MRTNERLRSSSGMYSYGDLSLDVGRHEVRVGDRDVDLAPREFEILKQFREANIEIPLPQQEYRIRSGETQDWVSQPGDRKTERKS